MSDCEEHMCRLHFTKDRHDKCSHMHDKRLCELSYLSHIFTHSYACSFTWRAAHLANRPHYTGGWNIDPLVEELKKSPFSSLPAKMRDMMSWGCLPALRSMKANLTCSHITLPVTTKMSARQLSAQSNIKLLSVRIFPFCMLTICFLMLLSFLN